MALEQELATYQREVPKLVNAEGKFVLIHGDEVVSLFDTYNDALRVGYDRFGLKPFLVKRVESVEQIHHFTRDVNPCPI